MTGCERVRRCSLMRRDGRKRGGRDDDVLKCAAAARVGGLEVPGLGILKDFGMKFAFAPMMVAGERGGGGLMVGGFQRKEGFAAVGLRPAQR